MRKLTIQLMFISLLAHLVSCSHKEVLHDHQGHAIHLSAYQGKWVIVNYWASWCHPCLKEIPAFNQLHQHFKNKIIMLGVNYENLDKAQLKHAIANANIQYSVLIENPEKQLHLPAVEVIPTTFIISPTHQIIQLIGPQTYQQLLSAISPSTHP